MWCETIIFLSDIYLREDYNKQLFNKSIQLDKKSGKIIIPKKRIKFTQSLKMLAEKGLLDKKLRRKHRSDNNEADIIIYVSISKEKNGLK